ncbi:MAG: TolC family protein [Alphaproteobacteria bacterium]|nr:TolC family protein [Alphaproteobacteria bacterium]
MPWRTSWVLQRLSRSVAGLLACLWVLGCNDTRDLAPATPDVPWAIPPAAVPTFQEVDPVSPTAPADINPDHQYSLAELIDIAERRNQATRIAWEEARQAAINVGIAKAALLPALTASAIGGYQRAALPIPSNLVPQGFFTANIEEVLPTLTISYLLLDFGGRKATINAARQLSVAANVTFTQAHQKLIFDVAKAYFLLDAAEAALRAAEQALKDAAEVQSSAEALYGRGLATIVTVELARRDTAQRRYTLAQARTAQHDAQYGLLTAMDLPPTTQLRIVDVSTRPLPRPAAGTLQQLLSDALHQRPDLVAAVAKLRASDEGIAQARSGLWPTLSLSTNIQGNIGQISVDGLPYTGVKEPQAGLFLNLAWPLYQGGLLQNRVREAESRREAAADAVREARNQALREVALAYDQVDTGLQQYEAAKALLVAAQTAFNSASDSYAHGVGTFTDAASAEAALAAARADMVRAHAQTLINAAALAFATGALNAGTAAELPGGER